MEERLHYAPVFPKGIKALRDLDAAIAQSGLDSKLLHLVKMRASQINGCAFCLDMHSKDARAEGESEQRLYGLSAWEEAPFYNDRERAALAWTDALTLVSQTHAPDDVYREVREQFNDAQLAALTGAIACINAWNRLAIGFRAKAGTYRPAG